MLIGQCSLPVILIYTINTPLHLEVSKHFTFFFFFATWDVNNDTGLNDSLLWYPRKKKAISHYACSSWVFSTASYLILPWDRDTASGKLGVEIIVCLVQVDTLNGGELLNVQNIFTVDRPGL